MIAPLRHWGDIKYGRDGNYIALGVLFIIFEVTGLGGAFLATCKAFRFGKRYLREDDIST